MWATHENCLWEEISIFLCTHIVDGLHLFVVMCGKSDLLLCEFCALTPLCALPQQCVQTFNQAKYVNKKTLLRQL